MSRHTYSALSMAQRHPRMFQALQRGLIVVRGQSDSMATPLPGFWGRSGGNSIDTLRGCTGGCHQGDLSCDCELACDIHPDADRVIRAPIRTRSEEAQYLWWRRWSKLIAMASVAALVALLKLAGARSMQ